MSNPPVPIGWNIQEIPGSSGSVTTHIVDITPRPSVEICEHHKKKKHRRHSSSSSCDSSSSSSSSSSGSSSSGGSCKKHSKHHHHHDHKDKKLHKKDKKHKSRHEKHEAKKLHKIERHERKKARKEEHRLKKMAKKSKHHGDVPDCGVPIELMSSNAFVPETKEQYEARQRIVRRVLDEETGRYRLIKGDGEVLEEIVSEKRHKEINRQATAGDGSFFEKKTLGKLSR